MEFVNGAESVKENDEYLYPPDVLSKINFEKSSVNFDPPITVANPGEGLLVRPLKISDFHRGYLELLSQLTVVGNVTEEMFTERFLSMKQCKDLYYITVIEDTVTNQVVGSATLAIERKFIHSTGLRGRLEDVVINSDYRGKQLGKLVVATIAQLADHLGCYKITLDCKDQMIKFYTQFGFKLESGNSNMMNLRFKT